MEDSWEDWDLKMMVRVLHMDLMWSIKEEGAPKRGQNMEWVQMEDLCRSMAWMAVLLEEMDQEMILNLVWDQMANHLADLIPTTL